MNDYQQYNQGGMYPDPRTAPMTVGQYIVTFLLSAIPIAGFILLLVWAFSGDTNINKRNYCRAVLILALISVGIYIVIALIALSLGVSLASSRY